MVNLSTDLIEAARTSQQAWHVPASVSLAQYAIESGWGAHCPGNNPFGIKALKGFPVQYLMTTEVIGGKLVHEEQPFAAFPAIDAAFEAHARLIATNPAYAPAMAALPDRDAFIVRMAGRYATDPLYAGKIRSVIASHALAKFDA